MSPKAIPERWIPYKACGSVIAGTRFICFKVPLRKSVQEYSAEKINEIWDIDTLLKAIPKLGLVIDLTNTARYYDPKGFTKAGIQHKKILMPGRVIPPSKTIEEFFKTVDTFLEGDENKLVGVHCTHGLNRTGFMVCRYLRDRMRVPAAQAIARFEAARGYKIERNVYLTDILGKQWKARATGNHHHVSETRYFQKPYDDDTTRSNTKRNGSRHFGAHTSNCGDRGFDFYPNFNCSVSNHHDQSEAGSSSSIFYRTESSYDDTRSSVNVGRSRRRQDSQSSDKSPGSKSWYNQDIDYTYEY